MEAREDIDKCLECGAGYHIRWKSGTPLSLLGAIDTFRDRNHKDTIAKGIWFKMPTK